MLDNQDNFITNFTSLFPPSPPPSSNQSEITMKLLVNDEREEEKEVVEIVNYTVGPSNLSPYTIDEDEEEEQDFGATKETSVSNDDALKDLSDFISQSRASPRTPPVTPRMMFFLGDERHPYQQMQQRQSQPMMDFDLYDLIDSSSYSSDYQLFPTLPSNNSS